MTSLKEISAVHKTLSDETRIRILHILSQGELSVGEIGETLDLNQSAVSNQLALLRKDGWTAVRKEGTRSYYAVNGKLGDERKILLKQTLERTSATTRGQSDNQALQDVLEKRKQTAKEFFEGEGRRMDSSPGEAWESLGPALTSLIRNATIVDLGCGGGELCRLLASSGNRVIGIDNSPSRLDWAREQEGSEAVEFLCRDMEATGLEGNSADGVILSHALHHIARPETVVKEAFRILKKTGVFIILDLENHQDEQLAENFGDFWMGFSEEKLIAWLKDAGFKHIHVEKNSSDHRFKHITTMAVRAWK